MFRGTSAIPVFKWAVTKKSSIQGSSSLLTYYEEKTRRGNERWYGVTRLRWLWQQSTVNQEIIRKRNEAYLKRKTEQAAFLAEKEGRRSYIPVCMVGLISLPCGRCICCCLVTRKVCHTALVAAPASWAIPSRSVDATLSGKFEESFQFSFIFWSFLLHAAHIQYHAFWREGKKARSGTLQGLNSSSDYPSHQGFSFTFATWRKLYFGRDCSWLTFVRFWR